jgi:hypothetical protein
MKVHRVNGERRLMALLVITSIVVDSRAIARNRTLERQRSSTARLPDRTSLPQPPMKRLLRPFHAAGLVLLVLSGSALGSSQTGTVARLHVRASDGLVYFYVDGIRSAAPGCASQSYWIIANENSVAAKQQLALLMMAEAAGKPIIVHGAGACTRWPDGEDVSEIAVYD